MTWPPAGDPEAAWPGPPGLGERLDGAETLVGLSRDGFIQSRYVMGRNATAPTRSTSNSEHRPNPE